MSKYTPGPWEHGVISDSKTKRTYRVISSVNGEEILMIVNLNNKNGEEKPISEVLANLRLVIEAPEMYELLKEVSNLTPFSQHLSLHDLQYMAGELIQKIEGEK